VTFAVSHTLRAFIAVRIAPPPPLRKIVLRLSQLGRAVRSVSPNAMHVTLKFLGDTSAESIPHVANVLNAATATASPMTVRLKGVGVFPRLDRPSVVWAGMEDAEPLIELARVLEAGLSPFGFEAERRPFQPHLTLARVKFKPPPELFELLDELAATDFGSVTIDAAELLQSEPRPDGPLYTTLATCEFTAEPREQM